MVGSLITIAKRKTSFEVDTEKVDAAREILGTKTMTETVDAALDEIVKREGRRKLLELLDTPGAFELDNPEVMRGAWR
jgi:Arc/MetJ family transcription regulator